METSIIVPGDKLPGEQTAGEQSNIKTSIGPGIYREPKTQELIPTSAGIVNIKTNKQQTQKVIWTESNNKRYIPVVNDLVVGVIVGVFGDSYKVQLQDYSASVQLSMMAFANATKKNRPNLKIGQAVYARVSQAIPDIDPELECFDSTTGKDGGFGVLDEAGYIFDVNLNFARELLFNKNCIFLEKLASRCQFEIAIGQNGKIWLKCGDGVRKIANDNQDHQSSSKSDLIKNLKATLAAAKFLVSCQTISLDQLDDELRAAFKKV